MKRPNPHTLAPDFRSREHKSLIRRNRVVVLLNDMEADALKRYQIALKGKAKAVICREAIMEKVIKGLDENQPTLF